MQKLILLYFLFEWSEQDMTLLNTLSKAKNKDKGNVFKVAQRFLIFPGTRWCGVGDLAISEEDLGKFNATDACCRAHDHCDDRIYGKQRKYGLLNRSHFTRMLCKCDNKFYHCLHAVNSHISYQIGRAYFNMLANKCFSYEFPIIQCLHSNGHMKKRCIQYAVSHDGSRKWQWFDLPLY